MKRSPINKVSKKKQAQLTKERIVKRELYDLCGGLCEWCKQEVVSAGHEIIFRSAGGDPTDVFNVIMLGLNCHSIQHRLTSIPPVDKDVLLYFNREKRLLQGFKEEE